MSKNLSVMHRVKWLLNKSALYMIYCTLVLPYISYCCEIWGNTYNSRIQPLYIIQKRAIRICNHLEYRSHSKADYFNLKTLTIADLVQFKSMVLMYKIYNNLMPSNILSYLCMVHMVQKCSEILRTGHTISSCSDKISTIIANGLLLTSCVKLKDTFKCGVHRTTIHFAVSLLFSSLLKVFKDTCPKNVVYRSVRLECTKAAPHPTHLNDGR